MILKANALTGALLSVFVLTACGGSDNNSSPIQATTPTSNITNQPQTTASSAQANPHTLAINTLKANAEYELVKYARSQGVPFNSLDRYQIMLGGRSYSAGNIDFRVFGNGLKEYDVVEDAQVTAGGQKFDVTRTSKLYLYQQDYSIIFGAVDKNTVIRGNGVNKTIYADDDDYTVFVQGTPTQVLPTQGKASYRGEAFTEYNGLPVKGSFDYLVDFDTKTGSGKISSALADIYLNEGKITQGTHINELDNSTVSGYGIEASANGGSALGIGKYELGFFGDNAKEIVGTVEFSDKTVGFAGKK